VGEREGRLEGLERGDEEGEREGLELGELGREAVTRLGSKLREALITTGIPSLNDTVDSGG